MRMGRRPQRRPLRRRRLSSTCDACVLVSFYLLYFAFFSDIPDQALVLGSPSGRISGVVKVTPSGLGFGVGVTAVCGDPGTPVSSWIRINKAKSSCTVLWQWVT